MSTSEERYVVLLNEEREYLENHKVCNFEIIESFNIDEISKLSKSSNDQYQLSCILKSLIEKDILLDNFGISGKISEGSMGVVIPIGKDKKPITIIKIPRKAEFFENLLIHESFVGQKYLNKIRNFSPSCLFTYGIEMCKSSKDLKICKFPINNNSQPVLFLEPVENFQELRQYLANVEKLLSSQLIQNKTFCEKFAQSFSKDLMNIFLQIHSWLQCANSIGDFNHNDLHDSNVLIQILDKEVYIPIYYPSKGKSKISYLKTKLLVKIIDYGLSYFKGEDGLEHGVVLKDLNLQGDYYPFRDISMIYLCVAEDLNTLIEEYSSFIGTEGSDIILAELLKILDKIRNVFSRSGENMDDALLQLNQKINSPNSYKGTGIPPNKSKLKDLTYEEFYLQFTRVFSDVLDSVEKEPQEGYESLICQENCHLWDDSYRD